MTGKVTIWYNWTWDEKEPCEAYLEWTPAGTDNHEMICKRGATFEEARAKAIEGFKKLPPSEAIEIREET